MKDLKYPFRVGRKQKRAVLDEEGCEVVIFPKGKEWLAELMCKLYNDHFHNEIKEALADDE